MTTQTQPPIRQDNPYCADASCRYCDRIFSHESWCATQNDNVRYVFRALLDPNHLTAGDVLSLHALGVAWVRNERK
jgi:hypothetical protein